MFSAEQGKVGNFPTLWPDSRFTDITGNTDNTRQARRFTLPAQEKNAATMRQLRKYNVAVTISRLFKAVRERVGFRMTPVFHNSEAWGQLVRSSEQKGFYFLWLTPVEFANLRAVLKK